jgi:hypothetical protein
MIVDRLAVVILFRLLRLAYGAVLIALPFMLFGVFHTMAEPYVAGALWGSMLPVGYVAGRVGFLW